MNYTRAITFFRNDPRWQTKVLIGALITLASMALSIVLIGLFGFVLLAGYGVRLMQNVRDGAEYPLPEWDDWGGDFVRGLKLTVIGLVWSLPIIIFLMFYFGSFFAMAGVSAWFDAPVGLAFMPAMYCMLGLAIVYSLVVSFFSPGFIINFAIEERLAAGFQFARIWRWTTANLGAVVIVVLLVLGAGTVIQQVAFFGGMLLCFVGLVITIPLSMLVYLLFSFHLYGQLAAECPFDSNSLTAIAASEHGGTGLEIDAEDGASAA